jgi:hypothetical protein
MAKVKLVQTLHLSLVAAPARLSLSAASIQHKQGITETNDQTSLGQVPSHFSSDGHEVRYDSTTCSSVTNIPSPSPSLALTGLPVLSYSQQYSFSFHLIVRCSKALGLPMVSFNIHRKRSAAHLLPVSLSSSSLLGKSPSSGSPHDPSQPVDTTVQGSGRCCCCVCCCLTLEDDCHDRDHYCLSPPLMLFPILAPRILFTSRFPITKCTRSG